MLHIPNTLARLKVVKNRYNLFIPYNTNSCSSCSLIHPSDDIQYSENLQSPDMPKTVSNAGVNPNLQQMITETVKNQLTQFFEKWQHNGMPSGSGLEGTSSSSQRPVGWPWGTSLQTSISNLVGQKTNESSVTTVVLAVAANLVGQVTSNHS